MGVLVLYLPKKTSRVTESTLTSGQLQKVYTRRIYPILLAEDESNSWKARIPLPSVHSSCLADKAATAFRQKYVSRLLWLHQPTRTEKYCRWDQPKP